ARVSDPGAKDITLESQIDACEQFIAKMGWPKPTLGPFADKRSGYLNVHREGLDRVERLIRERGVDVVVVLNFARLARDLVRRYAALFHAKKYGVEYRFAALEPDGKLSDAPEVKMLAPLYEAFGTIEREAIADRTQRGRLKRAALGLPTTGCDGAPYGYRRVL